MIPPNPHPQPPLSIPEMVQGIRTRMQKVSDLLAQHAPWEGSCDFKILPGLVAQALEGDELRQEEGLLRGVTESSATGLLLCASSDARQEGVFLQGLLGFCMALELRQRMPDLPFPVAAEWSLRTFEPTTLSGVAEEKDSPGADPVIPRITLQTDEAGVMESDQGPVSFPDLIGGMARSDVCFRGTPGPWLPESDQSSRDALEAAFDFIQSMTKLRADGFRARGVVLECDPCDPGMVAGLAVCGVLAWGVDQEVLEDGLARLERLAEVAARKFQLARVQWQGQGMRRPFICSERLRQFLQSAAQAERVEVCPPPEFGGLSADLVSQGETAQILMRLDRSAPVLWGGGRLSVNDTDLAATLRVVARALELYGIDYRLKSDNRVGWKR